MIGLILVRHCPTAWNKRGKLQGKSDVPLSELGRSLAVNLKPNLDSAGILWFSSPLARAVQTARIWGVTPKTDQRLIEADWGEWEGMELAAIREAIGGDIPGIDYPDFDFRPPGGESSRMVQERLRSWLKEVSDIGKLTVAVTHKGVIQAAQGLASGNASAGWSPEIKAGSLHRFAVDRSGRLTAEDHHAHVGSS